MKQIALIFLLMGLGRFLFAQATPTLALQDCYKLAAANHPLAAKPALYQELETNRLTQLQKDGLPSVKWTASASVQSENVELPFSFPGFEGLDLPLYRAQTALETSYTLLDGGLKAAQKERVQAEFATQQQVVQVELAKVKPQINQYFFGILLLQTKDSILHNTLAELDRKQQTLAAAVREGVLLPAELDRLEVERVRLRASIQENTADRQILLNGLGALLKTDLDTATRFIQSIGPDLPAIQDLNRPELTLFSLQKEQVQTQDALIDARDKPKLGAFLQAGVGVPNPLNFFDNTISPFAVGGLQFSWPLMDWGAKDRDRQQLYLQQQLIDNQQAVFEEQLYRELLSLLGEIEKLEAQLVFDQQIMDLQAKILASVSAQLDQGVATSTEYLSEVTAGTQAQMQFELHRLQVAQAKAQYLTLIGKP